MDPFRNWADGARLMFEAQRLWLAAASTVSARVGGLALGDLSEVWRMGAEKPPAFLAAHLRTMRALSRGKGWSEAGRAGLVPLRARAEANARRLKRR